MRAEQLQAVRDVLSIKPPEPDTPDDDPSDDGQLLCKHCSGTMQLIEVFEGTLRARAPPVAVAH